MYSQDLVNAILPTARFDGLTLAATDPAGLAAFWSVALDATVGRDDLGPRVDPKPHRPAHERIRLHRVALAAPDGSRAHLDLRLPGAEPTHLMAAGAALIRRPGRDPWYVLADPEGNQFCAFPACDDRPAGVFQLVVKCGEPYPLAHWWASVIGGAVEAEGTSAAVSGAPEFPWDYLVFDRVPEPKLGPNRLHWHVILRDPDPSTLVSTGARILARPAPGRPWWVLADPEGNEFNASAPERPLASSPDGIGR